MVSHPPLRSENRAPYARVFILEDKEFLVGVLTLEPLEQISSSVLVIENTRQKNNSREQYLMSRFVQPHARVWRIRAFGLEHTKGDVLDGSLSVHEDSREGFTEKRFRVAMPSVVRQCPRYEAFATPAAAGLFGQPKQRHTVLLATGRTPLDYVFHVRLG